MPLPADPTLLRWRGSDEVAVPVADARFEPYTDAELERPMIERFDKMAARYPDRIAVDDGTVQLTYARLGRIADDLIADILDACPPDGTFVLLVRADAANAVATIATLGTARVHTTIDPAWPADRRALVFAAMRPSAVIVGPGVAIAEDEAPGAVRIHIDLAERPRRKRPTGGNETGDVVAFTSGSTGMAKGMFVPRDARATVAALPINAGRVGPDDTVLSIMPASGAGRDVVVAVLAGAKVRLVDLKALGLVAAFRMLEGERITTLGFVPSALRSILAAPGASEAFHSLRLLETYGESLLASDLRLFRKILPPGCQISVLLGSTETLTLFWWIVEDAAVDGPVVPIGRPVAAKEVALVGEDGRSVEDGELGEILARSRYIAAGAWRDGGCVSVPSLSAADERGRRICATGDYARLRPDGLYEFAGRLDQQVKIRGLRADLGIVEASLRGVRGVADAVTLFLPIEGRLVAFVALHPGVPGETMPRAIRDELAKTMPDHMVPAQVTVLDAIPRLPNHKPDRVRLTAMARREA